MLTPTATREEVMELVEGLSMRDAAYRLVEAYEMTDKDFRFWLSGDWVFHPAPQILDIAQWWAYSIAKEEFAETVLHGSGLAEEAEYYQYALNVYMQSKYRLAALDFFAVIAAHLTVQLFQATLP